MRFFDRRKEAPGGDAPGMRLESGCLELEIRDLRSSETVTLLSSQPPAKKGGAA